MSEKLPLGAYHILELSKYYWFAANEFNGIFQIHKKTKTVQFLESIPGEDFQERNLVSKLIEYGNKIVFVPMNAKGIRIRDMESGSWKSIELKEGEHIRSKFFQAIQYENKIYMIGCRYPAIVCLDMETESIVYLDDVMKEIDAGCPNDEKLYFRSNYVRLGPYFYMASCKTNHILKFNMSEDSFQFIKIGSDEQQYSGIAWDKKRFWLSPRHGGGVTVWDEKTGEYSKSLNFQVGNEGNFIRGIAVDNNKVLLFADGATFSALADDWKAAERHQESYWFYEVSHKVFCLKRDGTFQVWKDGRKEFQTVLKIPRDELRRLDRKNAFTMANLSPVLEDRYFDLADYVHHVEGKTSKAPKGNGKMGKEIWNRLRY